MNSLSCCLNFVLGASLLAPQTPVIAGQSAKSPRQPLNDAVIVKLAPIAYPPLARVTRISGDVELHIEVNSDGMAATAVAISGHPLLVSIALDNAKQSRFECSNCAEEARSYRLIYTFQLNSENKTNSDDAGKIQDPEHPGLRVSQYLGHVVVTDWPLLISDPAPDPLKVRSVRCLYLWKCKRVL